MLGQLQHLEKLGPGHQRWKALRVIVEESRTAVNFELVERLGEREQSGTGPPLAGCTTSRRRSFEIARCADPGRQPAAAAEEAPGAATAELRDKADCSGGPVPP